MSFLDLIWLIPLFPLAGALAMLLVGRKLDPQAPSEVAVAPGVVAPAPHEAHAYHAAATKVLISIFCPGMVLLSFLLSAGAVWQLTARPGHTHQLIQFTWLTGLPFHTIGGALARFGADWGFLLDPLSSVMILVVTGVGFLIHLYSIGYMAHDGGYYRFFGYLNLFVFFMLMLVLANNYVLMFVGWEGVGLCSYLLIGFYFHKKSAADAGKKAFIVNRIGDAGYLVGMLLMFSVLGTVKFTEVNQVLRSGQFHAETAAWGVLSTMAGSTAFSDI
jgi:NADH-quinone oxidoreductase subunit L